MKRSLLLPYVVPAIESILLPSDEYAQPSVVGNSDPNAPPPVDLHPLPATLAGPTRRSRRDARYVGRLGPSHSRDACSLVEDEEVVREVLISRLVRLGQEILIAKDGREAIKHLQNDVFDVALINLGIPHISGDRASLTLKRGDRRISTVLMTGWDLDNGNPRLVPFDFRSTKPIEIAQLERILAHTLDLSYSQTENPASVRN